MENWAIAPMGTKIRFILGAALAVVGAIGVFTIAFMDSFEVYDSPDWLGPAWCGLVAGPVIGLTFPLIQDRFPGGPGDLMHVPDTEE